MLNFKFPVGEEVTKVELSAVADSHPVKKDGVTILIGGWARGVQWQGAARQSVHICWIFLDGGSAGWKGR
jgi:hypothetical protein